jgi:3-dehydroquinate dehydratase-2
VAPERSILLLNGPNLNLLGTREPETYGSTTLADVEALVRQQAERHGLAVEAHQSNLEGELVGWIHQARDRHLGIIINAAAYTHTSVAIHDALRAVDLPVIEVHLSNIHKRETFRHHSYISPVAAGVIFGLGTHGYVLGVDALAKLLEG